MADERDLDLVRNEVRHVLQGSAAFQRLDPTQRSAFAQNMVKVGHFLAKDPGWLDDKDTDKEKKPAAQALGPIDDLKGRLAKKPGQVGQEFEAGAMRQGVREFGTLVKTVDFPAFVSDLIQGVFQAIVDASIQQMEAYGDLLAATAKTVDQFAQDHISDGQARENLAGQHPSILRIDRSSGTPRLAPQEGVEDTAALAESVGMKEVIEFDDPESEQKLVNAAKLEMARQRQKMMALMVMLGINRIIVTNGRINAKVVFDIEASDYAKRQASASLEDVAQSESMAAATVALPWGAAGGYKRKKHKTTVRSSIDDESESKAEMKAQLTGDVRVNFRSETLPPERMLDALQFDQINYMSQAGGVPPQSGSPPATGGAP